MLPLQELVIDDGDLLDAMQRSYPHSRQITMDSVQLGSQFVRARFGQ